MTYPGVLFWLLALATVFARGPVFYYVFFAAWSFGTLAVVPPGVAIGNLTPPWIAACLLTGRVILQLGLRPYLQALADPRRFGFLSLCTLYAAASAYFLPRLFEGRVNVITMRPSDFRGAVPLRPDTANLTQGLYFVITTLAVVSVYLICQDPARRRQFLQAFGFGAAVAVLTGVLDLATSAVGAGGLLTPFRNAQYALLLENHTAGMHRVVGLMSEASSYAGLTAPFLALMALTPPRESVWGPWRLPLCAMLLAMSYLSTSSSGYVALAGLGLTLACSLALGGLVERRASAWWGAYGALIALAAASLVLMFHPTVFEPLWRVIDEVVLQKTSSRSYVERSSWNRVSYQAFLGTDFLGVGIGGARASSWIYSVLSNIGLPGALSLGVFMAQIALARAPDPADRGLARSAKLALLPYLLMVSLVSTSTGFGLGGAVLFGLAGALCWPFAGRAAAQDRLDPVPVAAVG
ncbi:hypothetical protein LJR219_004592 [Phenylobacterium sp. LjRoot219]|uniref:hypothetical protein n=1 Tax=Phenylobacterium sp. LjRoot219 TaxID=3342283 RepID=UPI003ECD4557